MNAVATICMLAATLTRFLDPYTVVHQSDEGKAGLKVNVPTRTDYWPVPCGLKDPLAKNLEPRIIHTNFYTYDAPQDGYDENTPSPLFKVNQVGYLPDAPKFAYMGGWLGPRFGAWKPHGQLKGWSLVDAATGREVLSAADGPNVRVADGVSKEGEPFTGENTYEMDFSSVTNEGVYYVRVPGVGRSMDFRICRGAAEEAFRVHMGGLYQKRCGIAKEEPWTHWVAGACHTTAIRGTFPPDEGTCEPKVRWFEIISNNTDFENGEIVECAGGWHDAADYDRRPQHLAIVNDLCAAYILKPENFRDGQLLIPENENGIPDILDEAEWGLRHLLAVQQSDGGVGTWIETTRHPMPGNVAESDTMKYVISRATRRSSLAFAAHAALLARCNPRFRAKYLDAAKNAWQHAIYSSPGSDVFAVTKKKYKFFEDSIAVYWEEPKDLPVNHLVKAAINLYALTGDEKYIAPLKKDMKRLCEGMRKNGWRWSPLLFAAERRLGIPGEAEPFFKAWEGYVTQIAGQVRSQVENSYAYRAPWFAPQKGSVQGMAWGQCHPLRRAQYLVAAHALTGDATYLAAASLANDFHNGCNPQGTTLTSGLGTVYPVTFLDLPSYVDGIAEYVPGITPYRWTYGVARKAVEMVFDKNQGYANKWPIWRRWANIENQTVAASEYTVWETIAPAASVTAYLMAPSDSAPMPRPRPAKQLSDLPGYWVLP